MASKASAWVARHVEAARVEQDRPTHAITYPIRNGSTVTTGYLNLRVVKGSAGEPLCEIVGALVSVEESLKAARWLIDTFGEPETP